MNYFDLFWGSLAARVPLTDAPPLQYGATSETLCSLHIAIVTSCGSWNASGTVNICLKNDRNCDGGNRCLFFP